MPRTNDALKLSGLGSRFAAFVAERHPFALPLALDAFEAAGLTTLKRRDAVRIRFGAPGHAPRARQIAL